MLEETVFVSSCYIRMSLKNEIIGLYTSCNYSTILSLYEANHV